MLANISRSQYSPKVRVGNWFEDICLEIEKMKSFRYQRDTNALLIEKTRHLFDNFHKEIELEAPKDNIPFGAIVQLMPARMNICDDPAVANVYPALSVIINERVVRNSQEINDDCELTIAPSTKPCVRNSFRIVSADGKDRSNEMIKYGQHFRLECVGTKDQLLICSTPKSADLTSMLRATFESQKIGEFNLVAGLCWSKRCGPGTLIPSAYTHWTCQHLDTKKRFESDGTPLPSNKPLIITHVATNRNLAAENVVIQTLFGPEYLVSVQTYKDVFKRETWQNVWMICNGQPNAQLGAE